MIDVIYFLKEMIFLTKSILIYKKKCIQIGKNRGLYGNLGQK